MPYFFLGSFANHLKIKLSIYGLNSTLKCVSKSGLEFFLLRRVMTKNSNIVELVNFSEKNIHIQIGAATLKMTSYRTMNKNNIFKKVKIQASRTKQTCFFGTLPFSPWAILAMWLHVGGPQKITRILNLQPILNKNLTWAHMELGFITLGVARKMVKYIAHLSNKNRINP
jgi:hypothetical protein